ncbi:hypothetical protein ACP70R_010736 [Stipagrostis hirtigluma subsp. patula]
MAATAGRALVACMLLLLLLLLVLGAAAEANTAADPNENQVFGSPAPSPMNPIDCGSACAARCALASRQKLCVRACGTCCARCNCVPPGTAGNLDQCPCYAAVITHGGRRKCP